MTKKHDEVNHPSHYMSDSGLEVIDVIEVFKLGYHMGNAVKYALRAGKKSGAPKQTDIRKAIWYLMRELENSVGDTDGVSKNRK